MDFDLPTQGLDDWHQVLEKIDGVERQDFNEEVHPLLDGVYATRRLHPIHQATQKFS